MSGETHSQATSKVPSPEYSHEPDAPSPILTLFHSFLWFTVFWNRLGNKRSRGLLTCSEVVLVNMSASIETWGWEMYESSKSHRHVSHAHYTTWRELRIPLSPWKPPASWLSNCVHPEFVSTFVISNVWKWALAYESRAWGEAVGSSFPDVWSKTIKSKHGTAAKITFVLWFISLLKHIEKKSHTFDHPVLFSIEDLPYL